MSRKIPRHIKLKNQRVCGIYNMISYTDMTFFIRYKYKHMHIYFSYILYPLLCINIHIYIYVLIFHKLLHHEYSWFLKEVIRNYIY